MRQIVDYIILNAFVFDDDSSGHLGDEVRKWIEDGWQPFGAPFSGDSRANDLSKLEPIIYQAMVKYESSNNDGCDMPGYAE